MATTANVSPPNGQPQLRTGRPRETVDGAMVSFARQYLARYGYKRDCACVPEAVCEHTEHALTRMQTFLGLTVTGALTLETLELMRQTRCPVPDVDPDEAGGPGIEEQDPFVFSSSIWTNGSLRWFLDTGTPDTTG